MSASAACAAVRRQPGHARRAQRARARAQGGLQAGRRGAAAGTKAAGTERAVRRAGKSGSEARARGRGGRSAAGRGSTSLKAREGQLLGREAVRTASMTSWVRMGGDAPSVSRLRAVLTLPSSLPARRPSLAPPPCCDTLESMLGLKSSCPMPSRSTSPPAPSQLLHVARALALDAEQPKPEPRYAQRPSTASPSPSSDRRSGDAAREAWAPLCSPSSPSALLLDPARPSRSPAPDAWPSRREEDSSIRDELHSTSRCESAASGIQPARARCCVALADRGGSLPGGSADVERCEMRRVVVLV